ncbi:DUF5682 family protein, partial [Nocardia salmonicida]
MTQRNKAPDPAAGDATPGDPANHAGPRASSGSDAGETSETRDTTGAEAGAGSVADTNSSASAAATTRVFGIRHHGPGSARSLRHALEEFRPDAILIEGPADADPLVGFVAADTMSPPVALLAYVPDSPARAAFWPFAVFSPEWQAMRYGVD